MLNANKIMAKKAETQTGGQIKIQYYRSMIGYAKKQKEIIKALENAPWVI